MSTNGILSITKNGQTIIKVVCGCDGMDIPELAKAIKKKKLITAEDIYNLARKHVGCEKCLVVQDAEGNFFGLEEDDLPKLYKEKFLDPKFNPRWERGTAAYTEIIESESFFT
ncbi:MAG: (2Fe-2S)-binding protein [Bacteroidetes bacterium]|nr:(2Fe-2S)-binding protein [Bacteroidota bacterium]